MEILIKLMNSRFFFFLLHFQIRAEQPYYSADNEVDSLVSIVIVIDETLNCSLLFNASLTTIAALEICHAYPDMNKFVEKGDISQIWLNDCA